MLKVKVDFKSFIQRGIKNIDSDFMIALITGYQGSPARLSMLLRKWKIYGNLKQYIQI